jgi:hypothetical protein
VTREHVVQPGRVARARAVVEGEREVRAGVRDPAQQVAGQPALYGRSVQECHGPRPAATALSAIA